MDKEYQEFEQEQESLDEMPGFEKAEKGIETSTICEHEWGVSPDQDPKSDMVSYQCSRCWSGKSITKEV